LCLSLGANASCYSCDRMMMSRPHSTTAGVFSSSSSSSSSAVIFDMARSER
jgi:hypothetical protein